MNTMGKIDFQFNRKLNKNWTIFDCKTNADIEKSNVVIRRPPLLHYGQRWQFAMRARRNVRRGMNATERAYSMRLNNVARAKRCATNDNEMITMNARASFQCVPWSSSSMRRGTKRLAGEHWIAWSARFACVREFWRAAIDRVGCPCHRLVCACRCSVGFSFFSCALLSFYRTLFVYACDCRLCRLTLHENSNLEMQSAFWFYRLRVCLCVCVCVSVSLCFIPCFFSFEMNSKVCFNFNCLSFVCRFSSHRSTLGMFGRRKKNAENQQKKGHRRR